MSRRIRTAALVSAATLLVGGSLSLGLAGTAAAADPGDPVLGALVLNPEKPAVGDDLVVNGSGCFDAGAILPPGTALTSSVTVTLTRPDTTTSSVTVTPGADGEWSSSKATLPLSIDAAGDYSVGATCTLIQGGIGFPYDNTPFTAADTTPPPTTVNPQVSYPMGDVAPGTGISITGDGFGDATTAVVALAGYDTKTVDISGGSFIGVNYLIRADQGTTNLAGTVTAGGGSTTIPVQDFTIKVVAPQVGVDGPTGTSGTGTSGSGTTVSGSGTGSTTTNSSGATTGRGYTASKPTLPNTGTNTLWPGLVGGLLVLSGVGLVWAGRRREQAEPAAV